MVAKVHVRLGARMADGIPGLVRWPTREMEGGTGNSRSALPMTGAPISGRDTLMLAHLVPDAPEITH
jgi:hypothetical protein